MQEHKPKYCCPTMDSRVADNIVTVNNITGTAHVNIIYTPAIDDNSDQEPTVIRIPLTYCPHCGDIVKVYSVPVGSQTYTRAADTGEQCNDVTCRFNINEICGYAFRLEAGCFSTSLATKDAYGDLRGKIKEGFTEMVQE